MSMLCAEIVWNSRGFTTPQVALCSNMSLPWTHKHCSLICCEAQKHYLLKVRPPIRELPWHSMAHRHTAWLADWLKTDFLICYNWSSSHPTIRCCLQLKTDLIICHIGMQNNFSDRWPHYTTGQYGIQTNISKHPWCEQRNRKPHRRHLTTSRQKTCDVATTSRH